jgi:hypothetical protein
VHDRLDQPKKITVHERLGFLEERSAKSNRSDQGDYSRHYKYDLDTYPQWCLEGFTKSQKRRVQRLRYSEQLEEREPRRIADGSTVWHIKQKDTLSVEVNMVFFLLAKY